MYMFATNSQVDARNIESLHAMCSNPICIEAQDFSRNPKTEKLEKQENPHARVFNTNLRNP